MAKQINAQKVKDALRELNDDRRLRVRVHDNTRGAALQGWTGEAFAVFTPADGSGVLEIAVGQIAWMPPSTRKEAVAIRYAERILPFTIVYETFTGAAEHEANRVLSVQAANEEDAIGVFRSLTEIAALEMSPRIVLVAAGIHESRVTEKEDADDPEADDFYETD